MPAQDDLSPALGLTLRSLRESAGMTLSDVSLRSGVSVVTIDHIERGEVPAPYDVVAKLRDALGVVVLDYKMPGEPG